MVSEYTDQHQLSFPLGITVPWAYEPNKLRVHELLLQRLSSALFTAPNKA